MGVLLFRMLMVFLALSGADVYAGDATGIGLVAQNLMGPVNYVHDFVQAACFIIGGSFVFASIVKYVEHRRSPLMIPISTVLFLFLGGIVLILLPFIPAFNDVFNQ